MEAYFVAVLIGIVAGFYLGNKKFRRSINNMIGNLKRRDDDEDYYDEEEEDE